MEISTGTSLIGALRYKDPNSGPAKALREAVNR
jgi:hypothetical protein